jgi:hypothetical protein
MDAVPVQDPDTTSVGAYGVSLAKRPGLPSMCPRLPSGAVYAGPSLCGKRAPWVGESGILWSEHVFAHQGVSIPGGRRACIAWWKRCGRGSADS